MRLEEQRHIEQITIEEFFDTGIVKWFRVPGVLDPTTKQPLRFHWHSWVLCEVSIRHGNPIHHCMFSNFSCIEFDPNGSGECGLNTPVMMRHFHGCRWNPSYEGEEHTHDVHINKLHYWKPIGVVLLDP